MRLSIFAIVFLCSVSMLFAQKSIKGSGNIVTKERSVSGDFTEIEVYSPVHVEVTQGKVYSIAVKADDNVVPLVLTDVSNNTLEIFLSGQKRMRNISKIVVLVTMPVLTSVYANGAASLTASLFKGEDLNIDLVGASSASIAFEGKLISADIEGASQLELIGQTGNLNLDVSSASVVRAKDMRAASVIADASSASSVSVTATKEIDATASSASSIRYSGNPGKVYKQASSAASIRSQSRD